MAGEAGENERGEPGVYTDNLEASTSGLGAGVSVLKF